MKTGSTRFERATSGSQTRPVNREQFRKMLSSASFIHYIRCLVKYHTASFWVIASWKTGYSVKDFHKMNRTYPEPHMNNLLSIARSQSALEDCRTKLTREISRLAAP